MACFSVIVAGDGKNACGQNKRLVTRTTER